MAVHRLLHPQHGRQIAYQGGAGQCAVCEAEGEMGIYSPRLPGIDQEAARRAGLSAVKECVMLFSASAKK